MAGRPEAIIDWKKVDDLLISGCSGAQIAGYFGLNPATIYDRCNKDHGIPFSEYSQQKYSKGETILKAHQFAKAIGKTKDGDNTLLIWLGKQRLGQKEPDKTLEKGDIANIVEAVYEINERNRDRTTSQQRVENPQLICDQGPDGEEDTVQT